jgi:hypothetical protein
MTTPRLKTALAAAALVCLASGAQASCGTAFCTLMTDRYAQGTGESHLGWSADLRLERVTQNRLRTGTTSLDAGQVTEEEAIERYTKNTNVVATLGYGLSADWSLSLRVPVSRRDHLHDVYDVDTQQIVGPERWKYTKLGDVELQARRQWATAGTAAAFAVFGGLKLPTGSKSVTNADGARAERTLQPGTGTTDLIVGAATRRAAGMHDAVIGQASVTTALNKSEDFRPGARVEVSAGWSHAFSPSLGTVLQLNLRYREHDSGAQAEPANSGFTTLAVSPGITLGAGAASTLYVYLQLPVYQKVRGIQLVPRGALALGWTSDF